MLVKSPDCLGVIAENVTINDGSFITRFHVYLLDSSVTLPKSFVFTYNKERIIWKNSLGCKNYIYFDYKVKNESSLIENKDYKKDLNVEKNLFQCVKNKSNLSKKISNLKNFNEKLQSFVGFKYYFYDDTDIEDILQTDMKTNPLAERVYKAYKCLRPGAFKADLFRYYILYTRGGVWMDDKSTLRKFLTDDIFRLDKNDGFIIRIFKNRCEIAFMAGKKENKFHEEMLNKCLNNIESRYYGYSSVDITGPGISKEIIQNENVMKNFTVIDSIEGKICKNGELVWKHKDDSMEEMMRMMGNNYYMSYWRNGSVYTDDNSKKFFCWGNFELNILFIFGISGIIILVFLIILISKL